MKYSLTFVAGLVGSVVALPQSSMSNELNGPCKKVTFIWARASTEVNNMGSSVGPQLCKGLKSSFANDVACQGVGAPAYSAGLADNVSPKGTTASAIAEATKHYNTASTKCPNTVIVTGGYSQGTAVIFNAVSALPANVKSRVAAAVLYGYTKNAQNKGIIPNYPPSQVKTFCPKSDGVCNGALNVNAGHFSYIANGDIPAGTKFMTERIKAHGKGGAAPSSSEESAPAAAAPAGKGSPKGAKGAKGGKGGAASSGAATGDAAPAASEEAPKEGGEE